MVFTIGAASIVGIEGGHYALVVELLEETLQFSHF